jgi:predicted metal-binding membrane protein
MTEQSWPAAAASFLFMWVAMMIPMMLPSLVPMLWRYRDSIGDVRPGRTALTATVGVGYFVVWSAAGLAAFPLSVALTRATPGLIGIIVLIAGAIQLTAWKARHLYCCRASPGRAGELSADCVTAWRHGWRLGVHCLCSCLGLTTILLVIGMMDMRAMGVVTTAITLERLTPAGERVAQAIGVVIVGGGLLMVARATGLA